MKQLKFLLTFITIFFSFNIISCSHGKKDGYKILTKQSDDKLQGKFSHINLSKKINIISPESISSKYINNIKNKIIRNNNYGNFDIESYVFNSNYLMAFATIGGKIYFSTQIIKSFTEGEVYAVMCHEIGHVINRDNSKIASLFSLFNRIDVYRDNNESLIISESKRKDRYFFEYIKKKRYKTEYQADLFAIGCLEGVGFDKKNIISFLRKMKVQEMRKSNFPQSRDTHPPINERIKRLRDFID